jgi:hypothetical protein
VISSHGKLAHGVRILSHRILTHRNVSHENTESVTWETITRDFGTRDFGTWDFGTFWKIIKFQKNYFFKNVEAVSTDELKIGIEFNLFQFFFVAF